MSTTAERFAPNSPRHQRVRASLWGNEIEGLARSRTNVPWSPSPRAGEICARTQGAPQGPDFFATGLLRSPRCRAQHRSRGRSTAGWPRPARRSNPSRRRGLRSAVRRVSPGGPVEGARRALRRRRRRKLRRQPASASSAPVRPLPRSRHLCRRLPRRRAGRALRHGQRGLRHRPCPGGRGAERASLSPDRSRPCCGPRRRGAVSRRSLRRRA